MERRQFFRLGLEKALQAVVRTVDEAVERQPLRWFRPPYAQRELSFLLSCTRCDKCITACPHQVLFALPLEAVGPQAAGTPAMDLLNHACRLCTDWPCVAACEPGALHLPPTSAGESAPLPRLSEVQIDPKRCLPYKGPECGACGVCPVPGALHWHGPRPIINKSLCVGCALCLAVCITQPKAVIVHTLSRESDHELPPSAV